jgi:dihydroorotate dehydrogenase (NAD+) catalytic subunit
LSTVDLGRGLVMPNPVGVASGTFGYGIEMQELVDISLLGAIFTKGTTRLPRPGNAPPRVAEVTAGMLNSIGLHNPGVEHVAAAYAPQFARWPIPVVVNVAGATVDEYVEIVRLLEVDGIAGYELNISCPNIAHGLDFGKDPAAAARVTEACRVVTDRCLLVKLSPNVSDIAAVARAVEAAGADAISAVNTFVGMKIHLPTRRPVLPRNGTGGMSGPAIKPLALAAVSAISAAVNIPVMGMGGICTADDALEFVVAGASAVQVGTATFVTPTAATDVAAGLDGALARIGGADLASLRAAWRS